MKIVILAGGQQSTINNEREGIPKPMAEIGEKPILWHIMKAFSAQGYHDFIVCGGYKVNMIKEYFTDFYVYQSDITVDLQSNEVEIHRKKTEDWKVTVVNTGLQTSMGERIIKIQEYLDNEDFIVTFGDCLYNIDISELVKHHNVSGKMATFTLTKPSGRNELFMLAEDKIVDCENSAADGCITENAWINADVMVFKKEIFSSFATTNYNIEKKLIYHLAKEDQVSIYKHTGFWSAIETVRDREALETKWNEGKAEWKNW